jgi:tetratricopeptide (TPR) repeat protein
VANRLRIAIGLALFVGTLVLYAQTTGFDFVRFDDRRYVTENAWVALGLTRESVWWALTTFTFSNWHPLTWLSYMLDFELYGLDPAGFHATNVLLHAANATLVFRVLCRATGRVWPCLLAAALFACHPLHVEVVAWIGQRKELLGALFGLLAIDAYVSFSQRGGAWRYSLVAVWMGLALMAKPMWVSLPGLLLLLDVWPLSRLRVGPIGAQGSGETALRVRLLEKLPLVALSLASSALTLAAQGRAMETAADLGLPARVANAVVAYAAYLEKTLWPAGLSVLYPHPYLAGGTPLAPWLITVSALLLVGITVTVFVARTRPYLMVGWLWFVAGLVPVIGIVQVGWQAMADRYSYVPHLGLFMLFAWGADDIRLRLYARRPGAARLVTGALVLLVIACAGRAAVQTGVWRDTTTLYRASIASTPNSHLLRFNLGNTLLEGGEHAEALLQYDAALRLHPGLDAAAVSLAWLLATTPDASLRDPVRALALAEDAARSQGFGDPNALDTLAAAHAAAGDFAQAIAVAGRAGTIAVRQGQQALARSIAQRLRSYEAGRAYVEPVRP